jgi:CheY-like chemotaxis protein
LVHYGSVLNGSKLELGEDRAFRRVGRGRATVLVVDDYADLRKLFAGLLLRAGFRVLQANDAEQAQRVARQERRIDVLVTDFSMPGMDGIELARWFKRRSPRSQVLLVSTELRDLDADTRWLPCLDKVEAFTQLAPTVGRLLAGARTEPQGFGRARPSELSLDSGAERNGNLTWPLDAKGPNDWPRQDPRL